MSDNKMVTTLKVLTPSLSAWEIVNRRSVEEAEFLEDSEAASQAVASLLRGAMLFAQLRGIRPDEVQIGEVKMTQDGAFSCRFEDPFTQKT